MTVSELIEKLKTFPPEWRVAVLEEDYNSPCEPQIKGDLHHWFMESADRDYEENMVTIESSYAMLPAKATKDR